MGRFLRDAVLIIEDSQFKSTFTVDLNCLSLSRSKQAPLARVSLLNLINLSNNLKSSWQVFL